MSQILAEIIERASTDAAFRAQLQSNPEAALAGYALTAEERAALLSGDPFVDVRLDRDDLYGGIEGLRPAVIDRRAAAGEGEAEQPRAGRRSRLGDDEPPAGSAFAPPARRLLGAAAFRVARIR